MYVNQLILSDMFSHLMKYFLWLLDLGKVLILADMRQDSQRRETVTTQMGVALKRIPRKSFTHKPITAAIAAAM